jgi:hypothetical protein
MTPCLKNTHHKNPETRAGSGSSSTTARLAVQSPEFKLQHKKQTKKSKDTHILISKLITKPQ